MSLRIRTGAEALVVSLACYAGAAIGSALRFPHLGTAILYPPYAIVTAALLLSPVRRWWIFLLAGSVGSFVPHRLGGDPVTFILMSEIANYARALLAAWGIRRFGDSWRFHTLKGMTAFLLFAVVLAPAVGAFIGAGVVAAHGDGGYWNAWRPWLMSNVLTGLTVLPIVLIARDHFVGRSAVEVLRRWREASVLIFSLLAAGALVLLAPNTSGASLYAPLPLLLWAAVRFGPGGTSAALLMVSALTIIGTLGERGPFITPSPADGLLQLQLFLFVVSVPLLLLSALLQEQRRTADELRASQQRYRTIVEDQTELICRFRPDGTLTFVNGAFGRAMGRPPQELMGTFFWSFVPPEAREAQSKLLAGLTPDQPLLSWEHWLVTGVGDSRWEQWRVRAMFDERGQVLDYQAVGRDITERKRAEEEHALLESQRAHADALREADRRKDEFLAMLAHELRNPLAPIAMAVEILRLVPSGDEQIGSAREIIGRQTAQLARLVDDLLDVARITSGSIQLRLETVDLGRVIASTLESTRPLIMARELRLDTDLPEGPLAVKGDPVRLAQMFSNLVNNSAKYSPVGGRISVTVRRDGSKVVLRFRDAGAGIPPNMLERIFEPFTQVQRPRDAALGGLGLGLALVKKLVELHGGTVRAQSDGPGLGSEFTVRLPAMQEAGAEAPDSMRLAAAGPTRGAAAHPLRILVVDDVADAADSLADFLRLGGNTVHVAHSGRAALELAAKHVPEVVFVDLQMPEIDGLEVARRLRGRSEFGGMVLVAMTGFGQARDRRQTAEAGFDHHLTKPLDPAAVQELLAVRRREDGPSRAAQ
jgi:PAS domain S-box-containing protein